MSYVVNLSEEELSAIRWVGPRYWNGFQFLDRLSIDEENPEIVDGIKLFKCTISESAAWELRDMWTEEEYQIPCFSRAFCDKIVQFFGKIV